MVAQMAERGPDSAGVAIYRDPVAAGSTKICLFAEDPHYPWGALCDELRLALGGESEPDVLVSHALVVVDADAAIAEQWLGEHHPELRVMSAGEAIEIYKEMGSPIDFVDRFGLHEIAATH